jgi:uncharacterized protein GlcG (DUF336 family)
MRGLSLEEANTIIAASFAEAKKRKCRPMSAIVLDADARVNAIQKQDGTSMLRVEICYGKAEGARKLMQSIENLADYPLFLEGGGQFIRDKFGEVLGAIGVTGDANELDDICAIAGIHAARADSDFFDDPEAMRALSIHKSAPLVDPHQHASPRRGAAVLRDGGNGSGRRSGAQNAKSGP